MISSRGEIFSKAETLQEGQRIYAKRQKLVEFLTFCIDYLGNNPSESWLLAEYNKLCARRDKIMTQAGFETWKNNNSAEAQCEDPQKKYYQVMGLAKIKKQIKVVDFLIGK